MRSVAISLFIAFGIGTAASASCIGDASFRTCTDSSGNSYTTTDMGGISTTYGHNSRTGSSWNSTTTDLGGGMTSTYGHAANGNSWNSNSMDMGGGMRSYSGTDARGNSFSGISTDGDSR
ncbi:hypothetical protein HFO09_08325 [Rhizobium laguerreae]|uniref:hypothetical protein n=1 Tax=Rhizobium laguerreae TaxID=1076926 RepID=UPI001C91B1ED|nr:hypothetical protein [Rhizobium laguerreae]MBY3255695.1 hypothetical protein [Rhizobium laguerreae]MBY3282734.1 hypothetical protein [Rhizobium laguerreae]MBY3289088.1 hypothetical protein [Rhizobium laguerreae]